MSFLKKKWVRWVLVIGFGVGGVSIWTLCRPASDGVVAALPPPPTECSVEPRIEKAVAVPAAELFANKTNRTVTVVEIPEQTQLPSRSVAQGVDSHSYDEKTLKVIRGLSYPLSDEDYWALAERLLTPQSGRDADYRQHEYAVRNEIMLALAHDTTRLADSINILTAVYDEPRQGDVMRGYALQHLTSVCIDNEAALMEEQAERVVQTLAVAVEDRSRGTIASTGLVGLQELSLEQPQLVPADTVRYEAMKLLQDSSVGYTSAISALQISAELQEIAAVPFARQAAFDSDANWGLRVSAVYALSQLDHSRDLELLADDPDKFVRRAVGLALAKQK
jgi:hypothetical protein